MAVRACVEPSVTAEATCDNVAPGIHEARIVTGSKLLRSHRSMSEYALGEPASVSSSAAGITDGRNAEDRIAVGVSDRRA